MDDKKPLSQEVQEIANSLWLEPGQQARAQRLDVIAKRFKIIEEFLAKYEAPAKVRANALQEADQAILNGSSGYDVNTLAQNAQADGLDTSVGVKIGFTAGVNFGLDTIRAIKGS